MRRQNKWVFFCGFLVAIFFSVGFGTQLYQEESRPIVSKKPASVNPVGLTTDIFADEIYKTTKEVKGKVIKIATPYFIKSKVNDYLRKLKLPEDVLQRINKRIESKEFVDEVVPFLLALKDQYIDVEKKITKYDNHIKHYVNASAPGAIHSLFKFEKEEALKPGQIPFDATKIASHAVRLYDLIFLKSGVSPLKFEKLAAANPQLVEETKPIVKALLSSLRGQIGGDNEIGTAIGDIVYPNQNDPVAVRKAEDDLETFSATLIDFITGEARKAYQMFAKKATRRDELYNWMMGELEKPKGGRLWEYLRYAQNEKRYGFQIVVDGLQGHLTKALANNDWHGPFMTQVIQNDHTPPEKPKGLEVKYLNEFLEKEKKELKYSFLDNFGRGGYQHEHYLPMFKRIYAPRSGASVALSGISTTPTISVRNLPIAKTGADVAGPGGTGIPNFHFVDRKKVYGKERAYYFFGNDALLLEGITKNMQTMFQRLEKYNTLNCSAQYEKGVGQSYNPFLNLAIGEKIRDFGDSLCVRELRRRLENEKELRKLRSSVLFYENIIINQKRWASLAKIWIKQKLDKIATLDQEGMPDYVLYYNPWPDHFAHGWGPFSDEVISPTGELNRLDYWLGEIYRVYIDAQIEHRTLFGMAGDHGLTPVFYLLNPEVEVFDYLRKQGIDFKVEKISSDEGEGPKKTNPLKPPTMRGYDVVVASTAGGNYMMDFFLDGHWKYQPGEFPLKGFLTSGMKKVDIIDVILKKLADSLDYLVVREFDCDYKRTDIVVIGTRQGREIKAKIKRRGSKIFYQSPGDLLGVKIPSRYEDPRRPLVQYKALIKKCISAARINNLDSWCEESEWRELTSYTERVDSVAQLSHLYDTDLAGTVNLFPLPGIGYNSRVPGRHAGEHFHEKDAFVGFWGGVTRYPHDQLKSVVNGSLAPTIYQYITGVEPKKGEDGWGFESVLPIILNKDQN